MPEKKFQVVVQLTHTFTLNKELMDLICLEPEEEWTDDEVEEAITSYVEENIADFANEYTSGVEVSRIKE